MQKWISELRKHADDNVKIALVGNKCDQEDGRQVDAKAIEEYVQTLDIKHFLTSAKTGRGVAEIFEYLLKRIKNYFVFVDANRNTFKEEKFLAQTSKNKNWRRC